VSRASSGFHTCPLRRLDADGFEDLPGKWQAAILKAEESAPNLRIVGNDYFEK
jgi:hypothetical protein